MDLDYKYKLVEKWMQEKQDGRVRSDMLLDLELGNYIVFEAIGGSTIKENIEMKNILNFMFREKQQRYKAEVYGKDKIRIIKMDKIPRKRHIKLWQLVEAGIIKDSLKLYFYDPFEQRIYDNEYAIVDFHSNLYVGKRTDKSNDMLYGKFLVSPSEKAVELRREYGITKGSQEAQGPIYWITEDGETLDELNDKARRMGL